MRIKDNSIKFNDLAPQIVLALAVAERVYDEHHAELIITSANDARHSRTSLHFSGNAVDLRTRNLTSSEDARAVANEIQSRLTNDFDVILESDHMHIEYQPKR